MPAKIQNTPDELIVADFKNGMRVHEIVEKYGYHTKIIGRVLKANGIITRKVKPRAFYKNLPIAQIIEDYKLLRSAEKVGEKYGTDAEFILEIARKNNLIDYAHTPKPKSFYEKFNKQQVYDMFRKGATYALIARTMMVGPQYIADLIEGSGINLSEVRHFYCDERYIDIDKMIEEYENEVSSYALALKYGVSRQFVEDTLDREGIDRREFHDVDFHTYNCDEDVFRDISTEAQAYWLGFIAADGCIRERGKRGVNKSLVIQIHKKDVDHLNKFKDFLRSDHRITNYLDYVAINVNYTTICDDLAKYHIVPRKTHILKFPWHINPDLYRHFIRGFFDGDGSMHIASRDEAIYASISTCVLEFLSDIKRILIDSKISIENRKLYKRVKINNGVPQKSCYELKMSHNSAKEFINFIYAGSTIYLNRKYEIAKEFLWDNDIQVK